MANKVIYEKDGRIGRITTAGAVTTFTDPADTVDQPFDITTGPDGNLWFTSGVNSRIGRITTAGVITTFTDPAGNLIRPFGITLGEAASRSEVRAVYGGFGLAIAGVLVFAIVDQGDIRTGILITVGVALAGMAFGRIVSAVVDTRTAFYPNWFYCLVEAVAAAALFSICAR